MFRLNENYEVRRNILKSYFIKYSPAEISTINTANSQIYVNTTREDSVISLLNSYIDLKFVELHGNINDRHADGKDLKLIDTALNALFGSYKLTTGSEKHLEDFSQAHIAPLLHKQVTRSRDSDALSIGFDRNRNGRQRELTNNKNIKGKYHLRNMFRVFFWFCWKPGKSYLWIWV